jgi:HSP20 family protein
MPNRSWLPAWGDRNRDVEHFGRFKSQVDSLFEDWFGRSMGGVLAPRMDVTEDEKTVTLTAELPGVKESDIDVSLVGDQLTIKGEKRSEHDEEKQVEGRTLHRVERSYGAFQRTLSVPHKIDPEQVSAEFTDGVLTITLPKPPDAIAEKQGRKIEVNRLAPKPGGGGSPTTPDGPQTPQRKEGEF